LTNTKKIVTFGIDYCLGEDGQPSDQAYVFKIWNVECIIAESYRYENETGIHGGTIWSPAYQNALEKGNRGSDELIPFMVPIMLNRKPY